MKGKCFFFKCHYKGMSVANYFAITSRRRKRYSALFPPRTDDGDPIDPPDDPVTPGTATFLTKSWRIQESDQTNDAYLSVEYLDNKTNQWIHVHSFNALKS